MDESKSKKENRNGEERRFDPELLKKGLRCDLDQYEMLLRCAEKKDITEWNEWREKNPKEDIFLEGTILDGAYLEGVDLEGSWLKGATLTDTHLKGACLKNSNLKYSIFRRAHLEHADLTSANLQGSRFLGAYVDCLTLLWYIEVDRNTDFRGVSLSTARIASTRRQLLEYNERWMRWEDWYKEHPTLKWLVKPFWLMSDYGLSTARIIACFLILAVVFASIFYLWGLIAPPGILDYLFVDGNGVKVASWLIPIRAIHFSVVVMTVGFTNMHANAHSVWAHILVSFQMILGFVLLGALVTRFAILFTAGGPAGKFADDKKNKIRNTKHEIRNKFE